MQAVHLGSVIPTDPPPGHHEYEVLDEQVYDAFGDRQGFQYGSTANGNTTAAWGQEVLGPDPVGFGGQWGYRGAAGAAYLLGHRFYDSRTGRFLTRDPIGYAGGVNLYGFVGNNPVTGRDPDGTDDSNPFTYLGNLFDHATLADVGNALRHNEVILAVGTLVNALSYVPLPENPAADVRVVKGVEEVGAELLYHYTSEKRAASILDQEILNPSLLGGKDARYGPGQYLTDLAPNSMSKGKIARRIWGTPRVGRKMDAVIKINVEGLHIENPAPHIYRVPGETPLDLRGRIIR